MEQTATKDERHELFLAAIEVGQRIANQRDALEAENKRLRDQLDARDAIKLANGEVSDA